jgi:hypothetical protein
MTTTEAVNQRDGTNGSRRREDRVQTDADRARAAADIADIQHDLGRTQNPNRLRAVKTFMDRRDARVYVPSSVIGSRLFNLLQDMDRIYANIERSKLRRGSAQGLQEKQQLETQIMTLIETLVEITATMAVENNQSDAARDPAVIEIIKRIKDDAARAAAAAKGEGGPKEERRPRHKSPSGDADSPAAGAQVDSAQSTTELAESAA